MVLFSEGVNPGQESRFEVELNNPSCWGSLEAVIIDTPTRKSDTRERMWLVKSMIRGSSLSFRSAYIYITIDICEEDLVLHNEASTALVQLIDLHKEDKPPSTYPNLSSSDENWPPFATR